jgi:predicted RNA-binding protein with PUA-like domain
LKGGFPTRVNENDKLNQTMQTYILKTEPSDYKIEQLEKDGETVWDGVGNNQALIYLRQIKTGDHCLIYHTGTEKAIVGEAKATSDAFAIPEGSKNAVVKVRFISRFDKPLTLAAMKGDATFAKFELLRLPRLSVVPVPPQLAIEILNRIG